MPISDPLRPFTEIDLLIAPSEPGVYALWDQGQLIYYGKADTSISTRLYSHFRGDEGACTQNATHYQVEINQWPSIRERELVEEFKALYRQLPRCNEVMP